MSKCLAVIVATFWFPCGMHLTCGCAMQLWVSTVVAAQVLTRLQLAHASVTSYPYFPDPLRLTDVIEAESRSAGTVQDAAPQDTAGTFGRSAQPV
jgi:hypothetical protein